MDTSRAAFCKIVYKLKVFLNAKKSKHFQAGLSHVSCRIIDSKLIRNQDQLNITEAPRCRGEVIFRLAHD